ncbi:zinc metallopeptidase [Aquabacterium sp. A7-Y]|uniref:KPN_02809 family neutral zinc metallopeptidase n=1 Tax=Aquabacterium sp. A7-Y TaxID=1349605 RepID=UPI00223DBFC8|nr:neutral zinc metallopeptidase [Aquabacterium sp. A7-Y]MCW7538069.1 zinc metallopeptidase [Aquabacterium sp. A7-Y]
MKWEGQRQSSNVEDRRGAGGGFGLGGRSIGIGSVVIALIGGWVLGVNPLTLLGMLSGDGAPVSGQAAPAGPPPANDRAAAFVSTVLASTEDVWAGVLQQHGMSYTPARLTLFRGATPTACGRGQSAMGPFYCPADRHVYIDLGFFDTLERRLGAPGDFAQAYVIAHEVGHHVQHLLGLTERVDQMRRAGSEAEANAASVRLELQADCFAGVWAHHSQQARGWLETGDVEEALNAASQIGDDTLQRRSQGTVVPESFTHGSSEQRVAWFRRGMENGSLQRCDTFVTREP